MIYDRDGSDNMESVQPLFLPSLSAYPPGDFVLGRGRFSHEEHGRLQLGLRDAPEKQSQYPEYLDERSSSILVEGHPLSGRTSLLKMLLQQASETAGSVVILDGTNSDTKTTWGDIVSQQGVHAVGSSQTAVFTHIIGQISELIWSTGLPEGAIVLVIDRIDVVVSFLDDEYVEALIRLIRDGSSHGLLVLASSDTGSRLSRSVRQSFSGNYRYLTDTPYVLEDNNGSLTRPLRLSDDQPQRHWLKNYVERPLGRLTLDDATRIAAKHPEFTLFVDDVTHKPVEWAFDRNLALCGGDNMEKRVEVWHRVGRELHERTGKLIPVLATPGWGGAYWALDLMSEVGESWEGTYTDQIQQIVLDRSSSLHDVLLVLESEALRKYLRKLLRNHGSFSDIYPGIARREHWTSVVSMARFPRQNDFSQELAADKTDHIWIQPPQRAALASYALDPSFALRMSAISGLKYESFHARVFFESDVYSAVLPGVPSVTDCRVNDV